MPLAHRVKKDFRLVLAVVIIAQLVVFHIDDLGRHPVEICLVCNLCPGLCEVAVPRVVHFFNPRALDKVKFPRHNEGHVAEV